jgi:hypothetical protein
MNSPSASLLKWCAPLSTTFNNKFGTFSYPPVGSGTDSVFHFPNYFSALPPRRSHATQTRHHWYVALTASSPASLEHTASILFILLQRPPLDRFHLIVLRTHCLVIITTDCLNVILPLQSHAKSWDGLPSFKLKRCVELSQPPF